MNYTRNMPHDATYWPPGAVNAANEMTMGSPVSIKCRWQDVAKLFTDSQGKQLVSTAVVYPDRPLLREGWLVRGISATADPRTVVGAQPIRQTNASDNLQGTLTLNKVFL